MAMVLLYIITVQWKWLWIVHLDSSSSIHLVPPLTVNEISKNNGGGGDSGGLGTITIISETKEDDDDSKKTYRLEANTIRLRF